MHSHTPRPPTTQQRIELRRAIRRQMLRQPSPQTPERIARKTRRIRIERAVCLIGRTKCGVQVAARAVGLHKSKDIRDLYDALDLRKIPRKHRWGGPVRAWRTMECVEALIPRPAPSKRGDQIRQPLLPSPIEQIASEPKPMIVSVCTVCGVPFEGKRKARYCGGACRIQHWRDEQ